MRSKSLKNYLRTSIVSLIIGMLLLFYILFSYIHTSYIISENQKVSNAISKQIFNSMYEVMKKGWSRADLKYFLNATKSSFEDSSYDVEIYRMKEVDEMFGSIKQNDIPLDVMASVKSKKKSVISDGNKMKIITPIIANNICQKCHTNSKPGDVLGAIEIDYDYSKSLSHSKLQFIIMLLLASPIFLLIAYLFTIKMLKKINISIDSFKQNTQNINTIKDFKKLDTSLIEMSFSEFDSIMKEVSKLANKLKNIAVDKDILEFEVKLLDKLIITADVVRDWKQYIKDLITEINLVIPVYCLITIFQTDNDFFEVEIFWYGRPPEDIKEHANFIALEMINQHEQRLMGKYNIHHSIASEDIYLATLTKEDIEHESKSLFLDSPKIGGIIGIGIQSNLTKDPIYSIVIDSILTTLINLVGSVKAIHKYTESLEYYATRDPLTGIFTQRVFRELLLYEVKRAGRHKYEFGVLMIDCDNFKPINDKYGHSFGDDFLKAFAKILEESKRDEDILARYGGDEFAMILPESDKNNSYTVAQRITAAIEKFKLETPDGHQVKITASIGIAMFPEHSTEPKELFNIADSMMYRAKNEGKNTVRSPNEFDIEEIHKNTQDKAMIVLDAIANDNIFAHFQPIMDVQSGKVEINELLMRIDMDNTLLSASTFIETAESLGVVHKMDYIVIEKAFKKIQETNYKGILFINLSPKALVIGEFLKQIDKLAHQYDIDKNKIVFEITERETVKSFALLEKFVNNLKLEGYRFAIDDFGSGFSTFHYIKKFPIDFIKIDGEFILNLNNDKKDLAFVKSIVALAKELEVLTIAEFVESEEVLGSLKDIKVDYVQGYHIGRPSDKLHSD
ncbi:MAG: GGDEF and EAL domain-containing protein [Sulfurospirillaceae bacterium]|nr:GGDEF and EAL domain-containing protein [Sulfurospirillaceae bacterium]